jgi:hypothetical protein
LDAFYTILAEEVFSTVGILPEGDESEPGKYSEVNKDKVKVRCITDVSS